jgi:CHAD domain-containing protein
MISPEPSFTLPESLSDQDLLAGLGEMFRLVPDNRPGGGRTLYHDSFDWRIYQAGGVLAETHDGRSHRLEWRDRNNGTLLGAQPLTRRFQRFVRDWKSGELRKRLEPVLEMRALLPRVELESSGRGYRLLNEDDKTVVRLLLEQSRSRLPGDAGEFHPLSRRLRLVPVRGYDRELAEAAILLRDRFRLPQTAPVMLDEALAAIGKRPADYSAKLDFRFKPEQQADAAVREIHLFLLNIIEANVDGLIADIDSEFLHDLRVAVRRTRSALNQIPRVYPEEAEYFRAEFAWLGKITGPARDLDVYLLEFDRYHNSLPEAFRADLDPLRDFLVSHHKIEQRQLVKHLKSARFNKLCTDWRAFLESPPPRPPSASDAARPIREVADRRIGKMFKRVVKEGTALHPDSPATELHELRKSCKKLRYLMEFFQNLYPAKEIEPLIKDLKKLLDSLGMFQDREVQANKLRQFAHQMEQEGTVQTDTLLAMGMLVDGLLRGQREAHADFLRRFARFTAKDNQKVLRQLISSAATAQEGTK